MIDWKPYNGLDTPGDLPLTRRNVLVAFPERRPEAAAVVVGYLKFAAGDKGSPYWVTPGFDRGGREASHWADILPDDFVFPGHVLMPPDCRGKAPARIAFEHQLLTQKLRAAIENHRGSLDELQEVLTSIESAEMGR